MTVDPKQVWEFVDSLIGEGERDAGRLLFRVHEQFGVDGVGVVMEKLRETFGNRADVGTPGYADRWQAWLEEYSQRSESDDDGEDADCGDDAEAVLSTLAVRLEHLDARLSRIAEELEQLHDAKPEGADRG
jgi:hypothetical protein